MLVGSAANLKHRPGPPTSQPSSKEPCKRVCSDPWIENPGVTHPRSRYPPASRRRARRSQACRRACWARAQRRGAPAATPRPRQQPLGRARTRAAGRGEGYRVVGVRLPNDGQAAADDGAHDRQKTATPAAVHVVRVDPQRLMHAPHAPPSAATSPSPSPPPPPARGRAAPRCSPDTSPPQGLAPGRRPAAAASTGPTR
jgi:hypothetical protein